MVLLVVVFVEAGVVEEPETQQQHRSHLHHQGALIQVCVSVLLPVGVVEHDLLDDGEGGQLDQGPVEGGQLGATGVAPPRHQVVTNHHHRPGDEDLVEGDGLQGLTELHWVHLGAAWRRRRSALTHNTAHICVYV